MAATLEFLGAAGEVTGSATLLTTPSARVLVDFGLFQGSFAQEARNAILPDIDFASIDAVVVTHAHVDHCGRLPQLCEAGCEAPIFCTQPTAEILPRVLRGSASLQRVRADEFAAGTMPVARVVEPQALAAAANARTDAPPVLYGSQEVRETVRRLRALAYGERVQIADGLAVRMLDASHVIGSASIEFELERPARRIILSGDLGPQESMLHAPHGMPAGRADLIVMECTNGAREFDRAASMNALAAALARAQQERRIVIMPVFALGRAQLALRAIALLTRERRIAPMPVFVDSAMASRICDSYARHPTHLAAGLAAECVHGGSLFGGVPVRLLRSREEGATAAAAEGPCVIMAGSGFCDAGPILRHLERRIADPGAMVVLGGHQIEGTLGHGLAHGATRVEVGASVLPVRAEIARVEGLSGHADAAGLTAWATERLARGGRILLNHGSVHARDSLAERLARLAKAERPAPGVAIDC